MKLQIVSFTRQGALLSLKIKQKLDEKSSFTTQIASAGHSCEGVNKLTESLKDWTTRGFLEKNGIIFIGAAGIAVRSIAPCLKDKTTDPPVLVIDEKGNYIIPILSGHLGHANLLAIEISKITGGNPVLTTASDVNHLLALDVFADLNHLYIEDMKAAKDLEARLLSLEKLCISYQDNLFEMPEKYPDEITLLNESDLQNQSDIQIWIGAKQKEGVSLWLIPKCILIGVGCRKDKSEESLISFIRDELFKMRLSEKSICGIYSIDVKKQEPGLKKTAEYFNVPFLTFSAKVLQKQEGSFTKSEFVEQTVLVDNVCERAVIAAGAEKLIQKKTKKEGMTLAIGIKRGTLRFE